MSLFVIADLHLSTAEQTNKSMEVFGRRWSDYVARLVHNWHAVVTDEDTVIIPGDVSWALTLDEAVSDFSLLHSLPGRKILGKGNHDFWWSTASKLTAFTKAHAFHSIFFLFNNAFETEEFILAGTRGWYQDESCENLPKDTDFKKLVAREASRLDTSLNAAEALKREDDRREVLAFLHFPPIWNGLVCEEIIDVLKKHGISRCFFGHIHGNYTAQPTFVHDGVTFSLISADFLEFYPRLIQPND
ncbi:MAG: metallophosphoesterase [Clostridia bacterium]|nr:metallophosphoesterase [Clostridia bacterium]